MTCNECKHLDFTNGQCRARSPQPFVVPGPKGQPVILGAWPATKPEFKACGEFKPVEN